MVTETDFNAQLIIMRMIHSYDQIHWQIIRTVQPVVKALVRNKLDSRHPIRGTSRNLTQYKETLAALVTDVRMTNVFPTLSKHSYDKSIIFSYLDTAARTYCRLQSKQPITKGEYRNSINELISALNNAVKVINRLSNIGIELPDNCNETKQILIKMMLSNPDYKIFYKPFHEIINPINSNIASPDTTDFLRAFIEVLESHIDEPAMYEWRNILRGPIPTKIGDDNFNKAVLVSKLSEFNINNFNYPLDEVIASTITVILKLPNNYSRKAVSYLRRQHN